MMGRGLSGAGCNSLSHVTGYSAKHIKSEKTEDGSYTQLVIQDGWVVAEVVRGGIVTKRAIILQG